MGAASGVTVALAVLDDMPMFEMSIAVETFGTDRSELADPWYELRLCAADPGRTRTSSGFVLHTPYDLDDLPNADTVIVPAVPARWLEPGAEPDPRLIKALHAAAANGARIVSLCTGAFALAAAGLLDGRRATTHWMRAALLAARHPDVRVDPSVLYVDEGDILTSAGRSAGIDLCLHLIRNDLGAEVANQVARRMVVQAHRPGGQAQYIETLVPKDDDESLAPVLQWATRNMDRQLTVAEMARQAGLSTRTLVRRFHSATGTTPLRWLYGQRLTRARALLESTDLPIERISEMCGTGSSANLRHHFTRSVGVTPTDYRRAFQSDRDSAWGRMSYARSETDERRSRTGGLRGVAPRANTAGPGKVAQRDTEQTRLPRVSEGT